MTALGAYPTTLEAIPEPEMRGSHRITREGGKVRIHGLEVFMAYDPRIDTGADKGVVKWTNDRLRKAIETTRAHMDRGSFPQFVVMHEREGQPAAPESVGSIADLWYEERDGVGYAVADAVFSDENFGAYIQSNRYPRRSAEFWKDNDHMSEVALLGRETPRRPLPDTHFARRGDKESHGKTRFSYAGTGGGGNTFVPDTGRKNTMSIEDRVSAIEASVEKMGKMMAKLCNEKAAEGEEKKDENAKPAAPAAAAPTAPASDAELVTRAELNSALAALEATKAEMQKAQDEARREKFGRRVDELRADGVAIKDADVPALVERIARAADPDAELGWIKDNFQRLPVRLEIPAHRAVHPVQKVSPEEIREKAEEFARKGDADGYRKWMNERMGG